MTRHDARSILISHFYLPEIASNLQMAANDKENPSGHDFTLLQHGADIILVSGDKPECSFYVHRAILAIASGHFEQMLTLPQPAEELIKGNIPQISLPENQKVISLLLQLIYPIQKPKLDWETLPISSFVEVFEAATKYDMHYPVSYLRSLLVSLEGGYLRSDPIQVFAVPCRFDLEDEKKEVWKWILRNGQDIENPPFREELKWISLWEYQRMDQWLKDRKKTIAQHVKRFYQQFLDNLDVALVLCLPDCIPCGTLVDGSEPPRWWATFVEIGRAHV